MACPKECAKGGTCIVKKAEDLFGGPGEDGKPKYEYEDPTTGRLDQDRNDNGVPGVDCSYLAYHAIQRCGYKIPHHEVKNLNTNMYFDVVSDISCVRPGDIMIFDNKHAGIVKTINFGKDEGRWGGTFVHSTSRTDIRPEEKGVRSCNLT